MTRNVYIEPALPLAPLVESEVDRRKGARYPIRNGVQYRLVSTRAAAVAGVGQTIDISSGGILFTCESALPEGRPIELAVDWPALIDGVCALRLFAVGRVTRSEPLRAAMSIERYQFRTRRA